jgi:hypothetical protein
VVQVVWDALGHSGFFLHHVGLRAPVLAMNMTNGMAVWMRCRSYGWAPMGEMSAAMFVPLALLYGPFWAGLLSGAGLLTALGTRTSWERARRHHGGDAQLFDISVEV